MKEKLNDERVESKDKLDAIRGSIKGKTPSIRMIKPHVLKAWDLGMREDESQVEALAQDMREQGYRQERTVIVDLATREVVAGNVRFRAAIKAGVETIPCACYEKLSPEERIVLLTDEGLFKARKSPMSLIRHLEILHFEFGFSYRDIQRLMGVSKSSIDRKLGVLKVSGSIRDLYYAGTLSEGQIERIRKFVAPEHQDAFAPLIREMKSKPANKQLETFFRAYTNAVRVLDERIKAGEKDAKLEIHLEDEAAMEAARAREEFHEALESNEHYIRTTDFTVSSDPAEELDRLVRHLGSVQTAIEKLNSQIDATPKFMARAEQKPVADEKPEEAPRVATETAPRLAKGKDLVQPLEIQDVPDGDYWKDSEGLTEKTFMDNGVSAEEMEKMFSNEPPYPHMDDPIHYAHISPDRYEQAHAKAMRR